MIDLHLHLDGSLSPGLAAALAREQGLALAEGEIEARLGVPQNCGSLEDYLSSSRYSCCKAGRPWPEPDTTWHGGWGTRGCSTARSASRPSSTPSGASASPRRWRPFGAA